VLSSSPQAARRRSGKAAQILGIDRAAATFSRVRRPYIEDLMSGTTPKPGRARLGRRALALAGLASCLPAQEPARAPVRSARRDAAEIARRIVDARVSGTYRSAGARSSAAARLGRSVYGIGYLLDAAGLDVQSDVDCIYAAAPTVDSYEAAHVIEHSIDDVRMRQAFDAVLEASTRPAELYHDLGFPAADIRLGGHDRFVALPAPGLLVQLPPGEVLGAIQFVGSGGMPPPEGKEVVVLFGEEPALTVPSLPWPPSLRQATIVAEADKLGGARVTFEAESSDAAQAAIDAENMTRDAEDATTIDLWFVKLRVLGPFLFRSAGARVRGEIRLNRDELEWVVAMTLMKTPGG
jgi:hypothetical protein